MPKVRLNFDGWLSLPAAIRQRFGLGTGDMLDLEATADGIMLRPLRSGRAAEHSTPEPVATVAAQEPSPVEPRAATAHAPVVKRGPGRPPKALAAALAPTLRARGTKRKITPATDEATP